MKYNGSRLTCGRSRRKGRGERQSFIVENWDSLKFFLKWPSWERREEREGIRELVFWVERLTEAEENPERGRRKV